jgi:NAD(P)H-hydrate epimerase
MQVQVPDLIAKAFPKRPADSNKYSVGTVTVVGGSGRFIHAPSICGLGARAAGAGLINLVVPDTARIAAGSLVPEATFMKQSATCVPPKADTTVIGIGLSVTQTTEMLVSRLLSGSRGNFVLDADALTILSNWYARKQDTTPVAEGQSLILTPHAGEAARLLACTTEEIARDRMSAAKRIVERYHAICVLKGRNTIVAAPDGRTYVCEAGNPFMAMGGMGDLLSGVIAARWSYVKDAFLAACSSVWLHAAASDALVSANPPVDPSLVNTASKIGSLRVALER